MISDLKHKYLKMFNNDLDNDDSFEKSTSENEKIKSLNKMSTPEYDAYIADIRDFYKELKGKKHQFEFSVLDNGKLFKKNVETEESEEIEIPNYINIKNEISENKIKNR